jgi:iron complex transport system substrate-binding protein
MSKTMGPRTALAVCALAALAALTGCSGAATGQDAAEAADASVLLPEAEGTTEYPLTLETPFGDTVLEERPERIAIVTASTVDTDALIALGGTPVFAPSTIDRNPWLGEAAQDIDVLWESEAGAEVAVEQVAASEPDLIVSLDASDTFDQARFDQVSAIAPVLHAESGDLTWQELTRELGEAVDLTAAADTVIEESPPSTRSSPGRRPRTSSSIRRTGALRT